MADFEFQDILSTTLKLLRVQAENSLRTYDVLTSLLAAIKQTSPELYAVYKKEMERQQISSCPLQNHFQTIDEMSKKLDRRRASPLFGDQQ